MQTAIKTTTQEVHPLSQLASQLQEFWYPQVIAQMDDYYIKIAKLTGALAWHSHPQQDELFILLSGSLTMEYRDRQVALKPGDLHIVPKGMEHNPIAHVEATVLVIEHKNTDHTGDVQTHSTRTIEQQLADFNCGF